jgi:Fe-S-cluster-containing dehydrogenase component
MNRDTYLLIDLDRCWGCKTCEVACKIKFGVGPGPGAIAVQDVGPRKIGSQLQRDSVPVLCQHCDLAACMEACSTGALYREQDGSVQVDGDTCTNCSACVEACPYGVIHELSDGTILKCDLCSAARRDGWLPNCAQHCPGRAITLLGPKDLAAAVDGRFCWKTGAVVYVSGKWASLGLGLS